MFSIIWPVHQLSEENVSGICAVSGWSYSSWVLWVEFVHCWKKNLFTIFWLLNFFIFVSPLLFCAAAYVSAIWRIYSSKELQRSFWKFWFRGSANNNWIDHFPGMLRTYFQQAFVLFFHKIFATNYQMRANKTNLFGMDLIVGTFHLN